MDRDGCAESEGNCGFGIDPKLSFLSLKKLAYPLLPSLDYRESINGLEWKHV